MIKQKSDSSSQSEPEEDRMVAGTIKLLWKWDPERITSGGVYHPSGWKMAKGVVILKPDYRQVRAHRVIVLLGSLGKVVEKPAAHLISDQLERSRSLHDGQVLHWRSRHTDQPHATGVETQGRHGALQS